MTCRDLIKDALVEIRAYSAGETPTIEDMTTGLSKLQAVSDGFLAPADRITLTLDGDLPDLYQDGLLYETALRLCGPFGATFTQEQATARRRARSQLLSEIDTPADAEVESGLLRTSLYRLTNFADFSTGQ